ncbi:branched-chain amino acid ABC transporter permease [Bradyrhizobium sp. DOA9]|uniref:branched-chain amino acid ABC transporter permease n=1 Tax=Bradyrhizobium sp. DOA9 TaxID=1126627 RepID=UPI000A5E0512|nr:branched-chain amino acid ABC transporter permease [Bradyrhizobium sp. DOA9]
MSRSDLTPLALLPVLMGCAYLAIGNPIAWLTLTIAGVAMGMIIFTIASGMTIVFGLMDVLNFGQGVFITIGAYLSATVFAALSGHLVSPDPGEAGLVILLAIAAAVVGAGLSGLIFERLLVEPVYGDHLMQILVTTGGLIVGEEIIKIIWGVQQVNVTLPPFLSGAVVIADVAIERYRIFAFMVGALVFLSQYLVFTRTKTGLLIRAGVHDREMVEALGYGVRRLFVATFVAGCALAGLGGVMWGLYQQTLVPQIGSQMNVLVFIVIIIGGLGSTGGALLGAILVGVCANYASFIEPKVALFSNIALMTMILLWRPNGLYPASARS